MACYAVAWSSSCSCGMVIVLFLGVLEKLIEMYQLWVVAGSSVLARNMTWLQPEEQHVHVGDVCDIAVEGLE